MASKYVEDDFVACLAFIGTVPPMPGGLVSDASDMVAVNRRLSYHEGVETFCSVWFEGKSIDGQWAGFLTSFLHWQQNVGRKKYEKR